MDGKKRTLTFRDNPLTTVKSTKKKSHRFAYTPIGISLILAALLNGAHVKVIREMIRRAIKNLISQVSLQVLGRDILLVRKEYRSIPLSHRSGAGCGVPGGSSRSVGNALLVRGSSPRDYVVMVEAAHDAMESLTEKAEKLLQAGHSVGNSVKLTRREGEVLGGVTRSLVNKEIAASLNLSERTAEFHVSSLLMKFRVRGRMELAREAARLAP